LGVLTTGKLSPGGENGCGVFFFLVFFVGGGGGEKNVERPKSADYCKNP